MICPLGLFTSKTGEWETPQDLFEKLNRIYHFNLDPCSTELNHKCARYFTKESDGLIQSWEGFRVFMNPPYGREIGAWVKKAFESKAEIVVCLLPARTDTNWFHSYIYGKAEINFLKGRLKFSKSKNSAPFPSMIVIYKFGRQNDS